MGKGKRRLHLKACEERNKKRTQAFRGKDVILKFDIELMVHLIAKFRALLQPLDGIIDIYHIPIEKGYTFTILFEETPKCYRALEAIQDNKNILGGFTLKNVHIPDREEAESYWLKLEAKKDKRREKKKLRLEMRRQKKAIKDGKAVAHQLMLEERDAKAHRKKRKRDAEKKKEEELVKIKKEKKDSDQDDSADEDDEKPVIKKEKDSDDEDSDEDDDEESDEDDSDDDEVEAPKKKKSKTTKT